MSRSFRRCASRVFRLRYLVLLLLFVTIAVIRFFTERRYSISTIAIMAIGAVGALLVWRIVLRYRKYDAAQRVQRDDTGVVDTLIAETRQGVPHAADPDTDTVTLGGAA